ncbi:MAG: hypothetical protein KGV51_00700 [Moraxellaceae bacterium]|nr:hypothetical protein [Moraxellaceae bacterium]
MDNFVIDGVYIELKSIKQKDNRLFIDGIALMVGYNAKNYADISYNLIFTESDKISIIKPLAKAHKPEITKEFAKNSVISYDKCWFTTLGYKGIDLSDIPTGNYQLKLQISCQGSTKTQKIRTNSDINIDNTQFNTSTDSNRNLLFIDEIIIANSAKIANKKTEKIYRTKNGIDVKFKHKPRKYDFNHIIFVFSGFLNAKPGNWDFINALDNCPCDVIWIADDFNAKYAYYLCQKMDFSIRDAVEEFIYYQIKKLNLTKDNVTVTGFSKGGSSALYFGLYLDIKNIVTSVPQVKIGSYLDNNWKNTANDIMGKNYNLSHMVYLDKLIPNLLKKDTNLEKNIYLLTSEYDVQYKDEILPYLNDFAKYSNFNLLKTYSVFVREHNQITSHHTALLLGIYYSLASEAIPRFGNVDFFGSQPTPTPAINNDECEPYAEIRYVAYRDGKLFIDGIGLLKGVHIVDYQDVNYTLVLKNDTNIFEKKLAKLHRPNVTREFFQGDFVVYDKCVFTTFKQKGMSLDDIAKGDYHLFLRIITKTHKVVEPLFSKSLIAIENDKVEFNSNDKKAILTIK